MWTEVSSPDGDGRAEVAGGDNSSIFPACLRPHRPGPCRSAWSRCAAPPTPPTTSRAPSRACGPPPRRARRSSACRSSSAASTSARREDHALLRARRGDPRPAHRGAGRGRGGARRRDRRLALREARRGPLPQHRRRHRRRRHATSASTGRCTSRTTRSTTRSSTSRPATSASAAGTPRFGRIGVLVCWDQWYPEAARLTALSGAQILFYPDRDRLAAAPRRRSTARSSRPPGRRSSAATPSPTACFVCAVNRVGHEGDAGARGHRVLGRQLRRRPGRPRARQGAAQDEEILVVDVRPRQGRRAAAPTGPSCATAASTPTATSPSGTSTE